VHADKLDTGNSLWITLAFVASWGLSLWLISAVFYTITKRYSAQMAIVHRLGGVYWQAQSPSDSELYAVQHPNGYFGLISVNAPSVTHFLACSGILALVLSAAMHWRHSRAPGPFVLLLCFMAPQAIALSAMRASGADFPDFPGSPFETIINPAARTVTGFDGTIGLCRITGGGLNQAPRSLDVDLYTLSKTFTLNSFTDQQEGKALLDQVAKAVRIACPGNTVNEAGD